MFATVAIISGISGSVVMAAPKTEANLETVVKTCKVVDNYETLGNRTIGELVEEIAEDEKIGGCRTK